MDEGLRAMDEQLRTAGIRIMAGYDLMSKKSIVHRPLSIEGSDPRVCRQHEFF